MATPSFDAARMGGVGDITAPTTVVHGDLDPVCPSPHGEALQRAIPGTRLAVLPETGHEVHRAGRPIFVDAFVSGE